MNLTWKGDPVNTDQRTSYGAPIASWDANGLATLCIEDPPPGWMRAASEAAGSTPCWDTWMFDRRSVLLFWRRRSISPSEARDMLQRAHAAVESLRGGAQ